MTLVKEPIKRLKTMAKIFAHKKEVNQ